MTTAGTDAGARTFPHCALFYDGLPTYLDAVTAFLREGVEAGEAVLVAVPGRNLELIRTVLRAPETAAVLLDMSITGRNPSRVIPAVRSLMAAHPGRRVRVVDEPIWAGRPQAEVQEATRHEALINAAFAGAPVSILCPYDAVRLGGKVLGDARRTHPCLLEQGQQRPSPAYGGPAIAEAMTSQPLPPPPPGAQVLGFDGTDLAGVRGLVRQRALQADLRTPRADDLVLAVNEVAANTVVHARAPGTLRIWPDEDGLICEVSDPGHITDPLAGRHLPLSADGGGHGLRLVNQVCDLVQLRSGNWGTTVRMHMRRG